MKGLWLHQRTVPSVSPQLTSNEQRGREPIACRYQLVQLILEFLVAGYEMCRPITGKLISSPRLDGMGQIWLPGIWLWKGINMHVLAQSIRCILLYPCIWRWTISTVKNSSIITTKPHNKTPMLTTPQPFCRLASSFFYFLNLLCNRIICLISCILSSHPALLLPTRAHFTSFSSHLPTFLQLASASPQLSINHSALECVFITYRELEHLLDSSESLAYFQI